MKSMEEVMNLGTQVSLKLAYKNVTERGHYHEVRDEHSMPQSQWDTVWGWADGLVQKGILDKVSGRCSLQATIDFDMAECEKRMRKDVAAMLRILRRVGEPVVITNDELIAGGWKP